MQKIIIDEQFKSVLPELDKEAYKKLEDELLENGCREPLVLWEDMLVDGFERYTVCIEHDIPFSTISMEFKSREEVLLWIIANQVSKMQSEANLVKVTHWNPLRGGKMKLHLTLKPLEPLS